MQKSGYWFRNTVCKVTFHGYNNLNYFKMLEGSLKYYTFQLKNSFCIYSIFLIVPYILI